MCLLAHRHGRPDQSPACHRRRKQLHQWSVSQRLLCNCSMPLVPQTVPEWASPTLWSSSRDPCPSSLVTPPARSPLAPAIRSLAVSVASRLSCPPATFLTVKRTRPRRRRACETRTQDVRVRPVPFSSVLRAFRNRSQQVCLLADVAQSPTWAPAHRLCQGTCRCPARVERQNDGTFSHWIRSCPLRHP